MHNVYTCRVFGSVNIVAMVLQRGESMENKKINYYDIMPLKNEADRVGAKIRMIFGQKTNGKSWQVDKLILDGIERGEQFVYIRRWKEDIKMSPMNRHFSKQKPDFLTFRNGEFKIKETGDVVGYACCLSGTEHVSGEQLPVAVKTIFFDECFTRFPELPREFETWQILLSTIIRERDDVNIYMVGNTVKRTSTYFQHYGIDPLKMKKGSINTFTIHQKTGDFKITCEYCKANGDVSRNRNSYFVDLVDGGNMISDGDFESDFRHTSGINGVTFEDFKRAKKLPFSFRYNGTDFELRVYNGVILCGRGKPAKFVICKPTEQKGNSTFKSVFPFSTIPKNEILTALQNSVISAVAENDFIPENIEVGEMLNEFIKSTFKKA